MTFEERFVRDVQENEYNRRILNRLPELGVSDVWLTAGCLFQTVWNINSGKNVEEHINDYDLFYFDADTSYEAEDVVIKKAARVFNDLPVEIQIRNQARVPLWYEEKFGNTYPYSVPRTSQDGIARFLVQCTCVGLQVSETGTIHLYAPYGLEELYAGTLRPNKNNLEEPERIIEKVQSYQKRWPWLEFVET